MITVRTSPQYVNRVRQEWTANGGVYGDGGVYAVVPSNNPFAQLGPTLDLAFAGVPTDQLTAATADGYSINLNLSSNIYQIAAQYVVWGTGGLQQVNFADIVTFTRASTATYFNSAGTLTTAAINEARFDYNPSTLAPLGFLIEEQRTNSIRNNTMQGAVAGTPGTGPTNWALFIGGTGISRQIVGTGIENGITYIDIRYFGTATTNSNITISAEPTNGVAAANGQTWTFSAYVKIAAGSFTGLNSPEIIIEEYSSAPGYLAGQTTSVPTPTGTLARISATRTNTNASTAFEFAGLRYYINNGNTIDVTFRIGLPQLELGAFATSVIPTTTTALTRSADVASVNTLSPWFNATEGTLYAEWVTAANDATNNRGIAALDDGSNNNRVAMFVPNSFTPLAVAARVVSGGTAANPANAGSIALASIAKSALTYGVGTNQAALCVNGGTPTTASPAAAPIGVSTLRIGAIFGVTQLGGYIRRITYYPRRLANADLQTITA